MRVTRSRRKDNDKNNNPCGCIICCLVIPWIVLAVGIIFFLIDNTRVDRIVEYNSRAKEWVENGLESFKGQSFTLNDDKEMTVNQETSGKYYPVRDSCDKEGDPSEKCVLTDALFYQGYADVEKDSVSIKITNMDNTIVNQAFARTVTSYLSKSDLGCEDEDDDCASDCRRKGGSWDSWNEECIVTTYLNNLCFRVNKVNDIWQLDQPPAWTLSGSGSGCYYSNNYNPANYGKASISNIPVHVRYYKDSFISADELTMGCSSSSTSSSSCFGMSEKEQNITGSIITGFGALLVLVEIAVIVALCTCCKATIKGILGKKKEFLVSNQEIPYAQPAQPAQPVQPIQPGQPIYPHQPNYGIPAYGQPAYGQPAYTQPTYAQPV